VLDDLGIVAALEWQTDEFASRTGIACSFSPSVDHLDIEPECATALFRVYQEVLTNVARHAEASAIQVSLRHRDGKIVLRVKDNGRGIREEEVKDMRSLGLVGMRERLLPWEGTVEFRGRPDHGTTVTIVIPDDHLRSAA
jgi:signal transduction histidine kinase